MQRNSIFDEYLQASLYKYYYTGSHIWYFTKIIYVGISMYYILYIFGHFCVYILYRDFISLDLLLFIYNLFIIIYITFRQSDCLNLSLNIVNIFILFL